jgi:hypothetical protein
MSEQAANKLEVDMENEMVEVEKENELEEVEKENELEEMEKENELEEVEKENELEEVEKENELEEVEKENELEEMEKENELEDVEKESELEEMEVEDDLEEMEKEDEDDLFQPWYSEADNIADKLPCYVCMKYTTDSWLALMNHVKVAHAIKQADLKGTYFHKMATQARAIHERARYQGKKRKSVEEGAEKAAQGVQGKNKQQKAGEADTQGGQQQKGAEALVPGAGQGWPRWQDHSAIGGP